jgi:hypothetical protein
LGTDEELGRFLGIFWQSSCLLRISGGGQRGLPKHWEWEVLNDADGRTTGGALEWRCRVISGRKYY